MEKPKIMLLEGSEPFFRGVVESVFQTKLRVPDPHLIDFIADLLLGFMSVKALYSLRNIKGGTISQVVDMEIEAEERICEARRDALIHIGSYVLFWMGYYPEALKKLRRAGSKDSFINYSERGSRAYMKAARLPGDKPSPDVLFNVGDQFEMCAYALGEIRSELELSA